MSHEHEFFDNFPSEMHCHICGRGEYAIRAEWRTDVALRKLTEFAGAGHELEFYGGER